MDLAPIDFFCECKSPFIFHGSTVMGCSSGMERPRMRWEGSWGWGGYMASVSQQLLVVVSYTSRFPTPGQMNGESPSSKEHM